MGTDQEMAGGAAPEVTPEELKALEYYRSLQARAREGMAKLMATVPLNARTRAEITDLRVLLAASQSEHAALVDLCVEFGAFSRGDYLLRVIAAMEVNLANFEQYVASRGRGSNIILPGRENGEG